MQVFISNWQHKQFNDTWDFIEVEFSVDIPPRGAEDISGEDDVQRLVGIKDDLGCDAVCRNEDQENDDEIEQVDEL